jgi:cysteine desulfurase
MGSACSSKKKGSHVLNSIGLKENEIQGAIRFSLSSLNTKEQIDTLIPILKKSVEEIRIITKLESFKEQINTIQSASIHV